MSAEEVKASNTCCDVELAWTRLDVGITSFVDGEKRCSVRRVLETTCGICGLIYWKDAPAEPAQSPTIVDLGAS